jgi:hypothetical protein
MGCVVDWNDPQVLSCVNGRVHRSENGGDA